MNLEQLNVTQRKELAAFQTQHGLRVRRATAMRLLCITDDAAFYKVVDANPTLAHRLPGEVQAKYLTAEIFALLYLTPCIPVCDPRGAGKLPVANKKPPLANNKLPVAKKPN